MAFFIISILGIIFFTTLGHNLTNLHFFMKKITFLLAFFLFLTQSKAQSVSGYAFSQSAEAYVAVTGTSSTADGDDGIQNNIPIGFSFNYGGITYSTFSISTNGWIRLGQNIGGNSWVNTLSNPNANYAPLIAAYWDDHNRTTGSIAYELTGTAPNRVLAIGWDNVNISNGGGTSATAFGSFKMLLHEMGTIDFVYGNLIPGGQLSASVGLNGATSFLSVTPAVTATTSSVTADNNVTGTTFLTGQKFTFTPQPQCSGTPNPGSTLSSLASVCENILFTLSLENNSPDFGISYQWQSSLNGTDYTDITDAAGPAYTGTQSQSTYYRCLVTCGADTAESTPLQVLQTNSSLCYCVPTYTNGKTDGDLISNVVIEGTTLSNNTGTAPINPSYTYFTDQPNYTAILESGYSYQITVSVGTYGQQEMAVWIDYNDDIVFTEDEKIGYTQTQIDGNGSGTFSISLSCDAPAGIHRMRIRDAWNTDATTMDPCANYGYGETEDYDITIIEPTGCQQPFGLATSDINSFGAIINWETGCGQTSWDVYIVPTGAPAPTEDSIPTYAGLDVNTVTATGLDPNTSYDIYVRAFCEANGNSNWAGPIVCVTAPMAISNDDCETAIELIPGASFPENAIVASNIGATKTLGQPNPTCGVFGFGGDVWFKVVVPSDGNLTIEVQSDSGSPVLDTAMTAFSGDCAVLTTLGCSDDEGVDAFSRLNLTGLTPGTTIYARVWEYANDTFGTFQVSAWNPTLKTNGFDQSKFGYQPNPVKDFLSLSYDKTISDIVVFNLIGQQVLAMPVGANQGKVDLSGLSKGAYLVKINAENQTHTIKIIKE